MTVSKAHELLVQKEVREFEAKGYKNKGSHSIFSVSYRPDAIVENANEVVLIEAVISNDHRFSEEQLLKLREYFGKTVRLIKVYGLNGKRKLGSKTINVPNLVYKELEKEKASDYESFGSVIMRLITEHRETLRNK